MDHKIISFDVETTGLRPYHGDKIFAYCIGYTDGNVDVFRLRKQKDCDKLQDLFYDTSIAKIAHNAKFELGMLKSNGIYVPEKTIWHDTMVMAQELDNTMISYDLDTLAWMFCFYPRGIDSKMKKRAKLLGGFHKVPAAEMEKYQKLDGERTMALYLTFKQFMDHGLYNDYMNEMDLIKATQRMEARGIKLDTEHTENKIDKLKKRMVNINEYIRDRFRTFYNLNSPDQVRKILFNHLQMKSQRLTKTGKKSVDKDALMELRDISPHPVLESIQEYRSCQKGVSMLNGYIGCLDKYGYIHTSIKTNPTSTGREASENPNMQNLAKVKNAKNPYIVGTRDCFVCRDDYVFFMVDHSGIEMRLIADIAGEEEFIEMIKKGESPHELAASIFYGDRFKSKKENKELYDAGKNAHFAKAYGCKIDRFAQTLGLTIPEAQKGWSEYGKRFPKVSNYSDFMISQVMEYGYITTAFGRKLYVSKEKPADASNWIIQGNAAGILKKGQVKIDKWLHKDRKFGAHMILPVHDEIIFEYPVSKWKYIKEFYHTVNYLMTDIPEINVPLEVEWKMSKTSWNDAKSFTLQEN